MSRSRKKVAVWKFDNNRYAKRQANKKARRCDVPSGGAFKKVFNSWDICDFKCSPHKAEPNERSVRK